MQHVFIVGAKGFTYGGYETFLDKLTEYHQNNEKIKYHIACKANGLGITDETKLEDVQIISDTEYIYHNAHCFKIKSLELGSAQAILYDIKSLQYCCNYIQNNNIKHPVIYVLSSRVGPMIGYFANKIHKLGGKYYNNPDGRENLRKKYNYFVRKYWATSEQEMIKHSDLVICDSINIEKYILKEYNHFSLQTTYIAYGSDITPTILKDDNPKYLEWLKKYSLIDHFYYISVGRFVPENNFEIMIREFMKSNTKKDFAIITTKNDKFLTKLNKKLHFSEDKRIKFVDAIYDQELLKKIRKNAYGYLHGHEVGGTNPSLLEALGITKLNLLYEVGFNKEVAENTALYWNKKDGNLAALINQADQLSEEDIINLGKKAKNRVEEAYSWDSIADKYYKVFLKQENFSNTKVLK